MFSGFSYTLSHNPPTKDSDGVVTRRLRWSLFLSCGLGWCLSSQILWQGCHSWVFFVFHFFSSTGKSFHVQDTSASLLELQHHSCSPVLPKRSEPREKPEGWIWESSSAGQSFPVVGVSTDWAAAIMLRFYCFVFIFSTPPPCQLLKKHSRVAGCLVMACFPAELSHAVATCWKPLLVPEDVFLWQQQSHFLTDKHSVPLKWFTSLWWCFSFCRIIAFLWPKSAPVYCSSFKQGRQSCGALNLASVEPVKSGVRCKILFI